MRITSQIETIILDYTREGRKPRYIVIGYNQYERWVQELEDSRTNVLDNNKRYMGCDVVVCSSDVIEVVADADDQLAYFKRVGLE